MTQQNLKQPTRAFEPTYGTSEAYAELLRRAKDQGVVPFDFDEAIHDSDEDQSQEEIRREVDDFLRVVRESRDTPSTRAVE